MLRRTDNCASHLAIHIPPTDRVGKTTTAKGNGLLPVDFGLGYALYNHSSGRDPSYVSKSSKRCCSCRRPSIASTRLGVLCISVAFVILILVTRGSNSSKREIPRGNGGDGATAGVAPAEDGSSSMFYMCIIPRMGRLIHFSQLAFRERRIRKISSRPWRCGLLDSTLCSPTITYAADIPVSHSNLDSKRI